MCTLKRIVTTICLILICLATPAAATTEDTAVFTVGSDKYLINGQTYFMDVAPYIQNDHAFLPIRYVAQALGISSNDISFNNGEVTLVKGNIIMQSKVGSNIMVLNGITMAMDVNVSLVNNRVMLPIRWIGMALGATLTWNDANQTITLISNSTDNGSISSGTNDKSNKLSTTSKTFNSIVSPNNVPSITYPDTVTHVSEDYQWEYNNTDYKWHVEIPSELLDYDREVYNLVDEFYNSDVYAQNVILSSLPEELTNMILSLSETSDYDFSSWVNEENNSTFTGHLAERLSDQARADGYDYFHTAEFVQSYVGSAISYIVTKDPELPAQTMVDNGDCKDKSILLASILKNMGYKVALLVYLPQSEVSMGHMAVGVAFDDAQLPPGRAVSYYLNDGTKYYFAETTRSDWLMGQISDQEMEKQGYIYPLN